jgi:prepilin-type N-terminal cleavage/methylation domain-containing protein
MSKKFNLHRVGRASERGFTLLEIMIVIVLLGVLAAVLIPKINLSKSKGSLLVTAMQDYGKALMNFKNDTSCYPTKLAALYDKTQADQSFCGIDLRDTWREPYIQKATFDSSGNIMIGQIVTSAFISILQTPNATGTAWVLRANGIPKDILDEAVKSCNGTNSQVGRCTSAPGGATGTLDMIFDENT